MQDLCQTISRYSGTSRRFVKNSIGRRFNCSLCATLLFSPVHSLQSDDVGGAQSSCKQCSVYTLSTGQSLIRHYLNIRSPAPTSIYSAAIQCRKQPAFYIFYTLSIFELKISTLGFLKFCRDQRCPVQNVHNLLSRLRELHKITQQFNLSEKCFYGMVSGTPAPQPQSRHGG